MVGPGASQSMTLATWREARLVFIPFDAKSILQIPLCTRKVDDFWAWNADTRGLFSVRSTYNMIVNLNLSREGWLEEREGTCGAAG